jgi:large subunit ribosomal protein L10
VLDATRPFSRVVKIKGAVLGTRAIDAEGVTALATLPPREVLQAQLAGAIVSPVATLAGLLSANLRNLGYALQQVADRKAAGA